VNKRKERCGCEKLAKAFKKVKPRLCCFGHIHEGSGATKIDRVAEKFDIVCNAGGDSEVVIPRPGKGMKLCWSMRLCSAIRRAG
jgi:Icc-related predicted phosphoesterase